MTARAGFRGAIYANTGTTGSPVWLEIGTARDVTLNLSSGDTPYLSSLNVTGAAAQTWSG